MPRGSDRRRCHAQAPPPASSIPAGLRGATARRSAQRRSESAVRPFPTHGDSQSCRLEVVEASGQYGGRSPAPKVRVKNDRGRGRSPERIPPRDHSATPPDMIHPTHTCEQLPASLFGKLRAQAAAQFGQIRTLSATPNHSKSYVVSGGVSSPRGFSAAPCNLACHAGNRRMNPGMPSVSERHPFTTAARMSAGTPGILAVTAQLPGEHPRHSTVVETTARGATAILPPTAGPRPPIDIPPSGWSHESSDLLRRHRHPPVHRLAPSNTQRPGTLDASRQFPRNANGSDHTGSWRG